MHNTGHVSVRKFNLTDDRMFVSHKRLPGPNQRRAMFERRRNFGEIGNGLEQRMESSNTRPIRQSVRSPANCGYLLMNARKLNAVMVKRVDQTPH